ncbi:hypothetical protein LR48_Vigan05g093600 [Vigna angularis]|uniref:Uncharacterized protein n=1 Tax=Phaseolus angularis TaxID=3914 RepID=A0A0L9UL79_PHAAN|nr:hypothetical protein LR48_Vigan05g093600 [Vigna angularis]
MLKKEIEKVVETLTKENAGVRKSLNVALKELGDKQHKADEVFRVKGEIEEVKVNLESEIVDLRVKENELKKSAKVLNEFTHGKQEKVSKTKFKEVLSYILLAEMASIFSQIESPNKSLHDHIIEALGKLSVEQEIPPTVDSWVLSRIVESALLSQDRYGLDKPVSQETFFQEFKVVALVVANCLKEKPLIVAHNENTFDGSGVKRLLSNKFELDKTLNSALEILPKNQNGKMSKEYLQVALDMWLHLMFYLLWCGLMQLEKFG